ncbi:hypothetical protein FIU86_06115 [Roseovarius sp. THAF9]|uniref:hypothetical protein n=1 Tax=Roseovarius sp. THAF9 TaxID=2587847 RepID=UPI001267A604|nr:hypothetical protein [Roseovarius sp. THAF9]QFT92409.1 hypothetical protein FIU86_06115 [Roseovarius sp. THAF9]
MDVPETMERLSTDRAALSEVLARYDRKRFRILSLDAASQSFGTILLGWMEKPVAEPLPEVAALLWYWCTAFAEEWNGLQDAADLHPRQLAQIQDLMQADLADMDARSVPPGIAQGMVQGRIRAMLEDERAKNPGDVSLREWGRPGAGVAFDMGLLDPPFRAAWVWQDEWNSMVVFFETDFAFGYAEWWLAV